MSRSLHGGVKGTEKAEHFFIRKGEKRECQKIRKFGNLIFVFRTLSANIPNLEYQNRFGI